jgi:hypothetical protein
MPARRTNGAAVLLLGQHRCFELPETSPLVVDAAR